MKPIRILLVDDHALVRLGLSTLLQFTEGMEVVGEAENGAVAVSKARELKPDVVILDLMMPVLGGVEATRRILKACPTARILILTTFGTAADVSKSVAAGASGALLKGLANEELVEAIRTIAAAGTVFSPEIEDMMKEEPTPPELTPRQCAILDAVTRGLTANDIACMLNIAPDTVNHHLVSIRDKLGAANRSEAVAIALRRHLLKS